MGGQMGGHPSVSFSLEYHYAGCAVRWAEGPEDLEPFDWTRNPSLYWSEVSGNVPDGGLDAFAARRKPNPYQDDLALPVPDNLEYPRLARVHPFQTGAKQSLPVYRVFRNLWKLAEKEGGKPGPRFRKGVIEAVPHIGLIDPYGTGDTLEGWWSAALRVHVLLEILTWVEDQTEINQADWDVFISVWVDWERNADGHFLEPSRWERKDFKAQTALRSIRQHTGSAQEVKNKYAHELLENVQIMLKQKHTRFTPGKVEVFTGSYRWAMLELSDVFSNGNRKDCAAEDCKIPFIGRTRYCSSTCEERSAKKRKRDRAKARVV